MDHTLHPTSTLWRRQADPVDTLVRLAAGATVARALPAGACIAVQAGRVWLTQTGDGNDYFVGPGQRHVVSRAGRVVIEGDSPLATLRVLADAPAAFSARPGFP